MKEILYTQGQTVGPKPIIKKLGIIGDAGECTPFVHNGRLYIVETIDTTHFQNILNFPYFRVRDVETNEVSKPFALGSYFSSAYYENGTLYVFGTSPSGRPVDWTDGDPRGGSSIIMYWSTDFEHWNEKTIITIPEWRLWNTSVCKGKDGYKMAFEVMGKDDYPDRKRVVGCAFTEFFAVSDDLMNWTVLPDKYCCTPYRYSACPALRYNEEDDYYYMICLEALPCARYAPYIYRSHDFETWEIGHHNPVMIYGDEDRVIYSDIKFPENKLFIIRNFININNSDVDLCEFNGKTYIFYLTGNQMGDGFLCEAVYDGKLNSFLRSFF